MPADPPEPAADAAAAAPWRVAALPFDVRPGEVARNLEQALAGAERAAAEGALLLVLPEKWTTSFMPSFSDALRAASEEALARMHERAVALGLTVLGSAPGGGGGKPFNELHLLGAAGDLRPYRKRMLFSPMGEGRQCAAGTGLPEVVETPVGRVGAVICYDLRFPEVTRELFYEDAELLAVPAQWPSERASVLELLARARAAENQCWVLACNRAGSAALGTERILDFPGTALLAGPLGEVAARRDDGGLLVATVDPAVTAEVRRRIPCARDLRRSGLGPPSAREAAHGRR